MKKTFVVVFVVAAVLSACSSPPPSAAPAPTQVPVVVQPTEIPPTVAPSPTSGPQQYFTEGFDEKSSDWKTLYMPPGSSLSDTPIDKVSTNIKDGFLQFDIEGTYIGAFSTYEPFEYKDVRIDTRVENHGNNTNDVALMCRYSQDGWYEFNIESSGLYFFNYISIGKDGRTHIAQLAEGGSNSIKQDVNEYGMACQGPSISMYINGSVVKTVKDNNLISGKVAVQGFSLQRLPVKLYFDWVKISQP